MKNESTMDELFFIGCASGLIPTVVIFSLFKTIELVIKAVGLIL